MTADTTTTLHECLVLINAEAQYSLWPANVEVPAGWSVVHQATSREDAIAYVESHWTDMRPASLRT
jgi:MbtH protein